MKLICALLLCLAAVHGKKLYEGYEVIRTAPLTRSEVDLLGPLEAQLDFWKSPRVGRKADIMVKPEEKEQLKTLLKRAGIDFHVWINDFPQRIAALEKDIAPLSTSRQIDWDNYYRYDNIISWLQGMADGNTNVDLVSIGSTYEDRTMYVLQIAQAGSGAENIWIDAGIHAREWVSPAATTYFINELLKDDTYKDVRDQFNIHILVVANPDGYEYTFTDEQNWRKTRSNYGTTCTGVDPNRNFEYEWGGQGTSDNPCSEIYRGPTVWSEIETQNMRDYVLALNPAPLVGHSVHTYGEMWLLPYGYARGVYPPNYDEIKRLGDVAGDAIRGVRNHQYTVDNSGDYYGPAAGATDDYYRGLAGSTYSWTSELTDTIYGFHPPASEIQPAGQELTAAIVAYLRDRM